MKTPSRLIILLAGLVLCTVCGVLYAWSIFVVPLEQAFGWQRPETSLTFTFMITFFSLGMFAGGKLLRFGPARAVQIGGALLCVGLLWASRIDSVIGLYLSYGVVSGFGIGIVNLVPAAVCLRWYPERKGLVSGLLTMALALGTLLFGTVGAGWLIGKVGVSSTFMALAVLFLGIIVLGSLFLRMPEAAPGKEEGDGVGLRDMLHTPSYWMIWAG
ncbi:MAG: MFS transporter [Bilophila wadsworthia]